MTTSESNGHSPLRPKRSESRQRQRGAAARVALNALWNANKRSGNLPRHSFAEVAPDGEFPSVLAYRSLLARLVPSWQYSIRSLSERSRFALHLIICLLTVAITLGEWLQSWSVQAVAPWQERSVVMLGGAVEFAPSAERVAVMLPATDLTFAPVTGQSAELVAPALSRPRPVAAAFGETHVLAGTETLGSIAERYNISIESLIWSNGLENGDVLVTGQELRIPRVSGLPYVVQAGDTVAGIAVRFGVAPEAIMLFEPNRLSAGGELPVGQEIFIPGGVRPLPDVLLTLRGGIVGLAESQAQSAGIVRERETNLREGPGQEYARLVQLDAGRRAQLLGRYGDWLKVDVAGTTGWIRADLLMVDEEQIAVLPETTDFPPPPPVWVWPTRGTLTSYFGPRWGGFHNGVDIANRAWTPIVAARAGRVIEAGWCSGYGYCVKITHDGGVQTIYGHLIDQPVVDVGEDVAVGQLIGHMGSTYDRRGGGYSTGVHLHFTITVNGRAVNPLKFLP